MDIVCKCNNVNEKQVRDAYQNGMSKYDLKEKCFIGTKCGCCNKEDCPIIDININVLYKELSKS